MFGGLVQCFVLRLARRLFAYLLVAPGMPSWIAAAAGTGCFIEFSREAIAANGWVTS